MIVLRPGCKINLGLAVTGRQASGYHSLSTFFYPLQYPADWLGIVPGEPGQIAIKCSAPEIDANDNLLRKAWLAFGNATGIWRGYRLYLEKRIPSGAGLGGGSSDAAALLEFLNREAGRPLEQAGLERLAFSLGADVPFFLRKSPCFAAGAGEKLVETAFAGERQWLVLVSPAIHAATARVFERWDELDAGPGEAVGEGNETRQLSGFGPRAGASGSGTGLTKASSPARNTISASGVDLANDLESAVFSLWPELERLKEQLLAAGASKAGMSGSGASFFGFFDCREMATTAARQLRKNWHRAYCAQLRDFGM